MAPAVTHLAVQTTRPARAARFYAERFRLVATRYDARAVGFDVGGTMLLLRRPGADPAGGEHVHYALTAPAAEFGRWRDRFPDAEVVSFGDARSIYPFDPDGHCPEIACFGDRGVGLTGVFEIVLEVAELEPAERAYARLGFEPIDRGDDRRRVRLRGPADGPGSVDLELWEPHRGLAGAQGGAHVDFGLRVRDPAGVARRAFGDDPDASVYTGGETGRARLPSGVPERGERPADHAVVTDRDGHWLHLVESGDA